MKSVKVTIVNIILNITLSFHIGSLGSKTICMTMNLIIDHVFFAAPNTLFQARRTKDPLLTSPVDNGKRQQLKTSDHDLPILLIDLVPV